MQRALIFLNPCGREAGRHKLKNGLKTQKMHFLPVFELKFCWESLRRANLLTVLFDLCPLQIEEMLELDIDSLL